MRVQRRRVTVRLATIFVVLLGILSLTVQRGQANGASGLQLVESNGQQWIVGCVTDDVAQHLVEHAGFGIGGPSVILCIEGYTLVGKQLN